MIVDINGTLLESDEARIDPVDRGFTLGDGIFETICIRNGTPRRFDAHMNRLRGGAKVLSLTVPTTDAAIAARIEKLLEANDLVDAVVRLTLRRGPGPRGVRPPDTPTPTLLLSAAPLPAPAAPARAIISLTTCRNEHSPLAGVKSLNYLDSIIACREADQYGVDEALLLNTQGRLAEAAYSNLFLLIDGALVTPPVSEGALPGVVRADLLAKFRAQELALEVDDLGRAEEAFLTSALGIRPLIEVANQLIGDGEPGLVTQMLAARV